MNYFGVYHSDYSRAGSARVDGGVCDAPCMTKGRMTLCADGIASEGGALAMTRGRMGECPVFYVLRKTTTAFADHPDTLLKSNRLEPVADGDCLRELFGLGPAWSPGRTYYRDMAMLEPGCALVIRENRARVDRYFD